MDNVIMVTNQKNELSKAISRRIDEILRITKLSLHELASLTTIDLQALKAYHQEQEAITLESALKICSTLSLNFNMFCDFNKKLSFKFQQSSFPQVPEKAKIKKRLEQESEVFDREQREKNEKNKKLRDQILHIAQATNYFLRPRTLSQMILDFATDYGLSVTEQRLQGILLRCVANGILQRYSTPWDYGIGYSLPKRTWVYFKGEKDHLNDCGNIFGYNWISSTILP
jgi:DNA-binding Xre family transcriptional regulator